MTVLRDSKYRDIIDFEPLLKDTSFLSFKSQEGLFKGDEIKYWVKMTPRYSL